jgi:hypothetical protein
MLFFIILLCYNIIINNILLYYIKLVSEELYRRYLEMSRDIEGSATSYHKTIPLNLPQFLRCWKV